MIKIRPHHLLCALTFTGRGYNKAFVAEFGTLIDGLKRGAEIDWVFAPDSLCQATMRDANHHCNDEMSAMRDKLARTDIEALLGEAPLMFDATKLDQLRKAFARQTLRHACEGCAFHAFCTGIADGGFVRAHLDMVQDTDGRND